MMRAEGRPLVGRSRVGSATLAALVAITVFGAWLRVQGLTSLTLYTDDAWAAMPARVGIGTATRMGVTAPGYYLAERAWIHLAPGSTVWAQIPALVLGLVAVAAAYVLVRTYGLARWLGLVAAVLVATGPVMVAYSTHVKEYGADFVLASALLGLAETARRSRSSVRLLGLLAGLSVVSFFVSASVVTVLAAAWVALLIDGFSDGERRRRVLAWGGGAAGACAVIALALFRSLPPSLHEFWLTRGFFAHPSSATALAAQLRNVATSMLGGLGLWPRHVPPGGFGIEPVPVPGIFSNLAVGPARTAVFVVAVVLLVAGLSSGRRALAPALVLVASGLAWAVSVVPLGSGRTDTIVYPAILVLLALGVHRITAAIGSSLAVGGLPRCGLQMAGGVTLAVWIAVLVVQPGTPRVPYPAVDTQTLAHHISAERQPGDIVMVAPGERFPWGYAATSAVRIRFGGQWTMGFTVESADPGTFIAPGCADEPGYDPDTWAEAARNASRVWYVGSGTICDPQPEQDQLYQALIGQGFRPVDRVDAQANYVVLLEQT
jgi:hypothetical protein